MAVLKKSSAGHFRRFKGYDYTRGGSIFITTTLAERRPLLGRVEHDRVVLSSAGEILAAQIARVKGEFPNLMVRSLAIMPDHLHLRLTWPAGLEAPVVDIGNFVGRIKQYSQHRIREAMEASRQVGLGEGAGVEPTWLEALVASNIWQKGYHDHLCLSRFINEQVDKYIANNPLKWHLMHGPGCLRVQEPLFSERLPRDEWWNGVGNLALLDDTTKLCAVQLSRRIRSCDYEAILSRLMAAAREKGYVFAGSFISPLERILFDRLIAAKLPVVRAVPDPLAMVYRPKGDEPQLFDSGRLLLLSRQVEAEDRYTAWHGINAALGAVARVKGDDLYVRPGYDGRAAFWFNDKATEERRAVKALRQVGGSGVAAPPTWRRPL